MKLIIIIRRRILMIIIYSCILIEKSTYANISIPTRFSLHRRSKQISQDHTVTDIALNNRLSIWTQFLSINQSIIIVILIIIFNIYHHHHHHHHHHHFIIIITSSLHPTLCTRPGLEACCIILSNSASFLLSAK